MENNRNHISDEELAAYLDGNVSKEEMADILSSLGDNPEAAEILALSPEIDKELTKGKNRLLPMWALAAANPENLCSFECEAFILKHLGYNVDHWTLLEEAKANNWVREEGTPLYQVGKLLELKGLYVEREYDANSGDIEYALRDGKHVIVVVDNNELSGIRNDDSPAFHALCVTMIDPEEGCDIRYVNPTTGVERYIDVGDFLRAWKASGNYMVTASRVANGYNPQPINVEDIDLDSNLEELTEAIAENAHDIWARARMDEGWTYGPVRNDELRQHPDLVPYSQLPDSEKEYDRLMAMNTLRLVRRLGFDIVNRNKYNHL